MEEDTPDSPPADGDVGTTPARPTLQLDKKTEQGFCVFYRGMPKVRRPERRAPRPVTRESGQGSGALTLWWGAACSGYHDGRAPRTRCGSLNARYVSICQHRPRLPIPLPALSSDVESVSTRRRTFTRPTARTRTLWRKPCSRRRRSSSTSAAVRNHPNVHGFGANRAHPPDAVRVFARFCRQHIGDSRRDPVPHADDLAAARPAHEQAVPRRDLGAGEPHQLELEDQAAGPLAVARPVPTLLVAPLTADVPSC